MCSLTPRYDAHRGAFYKFEYLGDIEIEFENTLGLPLLRGGRRGTYLSLQVVSSGLQMGSSLLRGGRRDIPVTAGRLPRPTNGLVRAEQWTRRGGLGHYVAVVHCLLQHGMSY